LRVFSKLLQQAHPRSRGFECLASVMHSGGPARPIAITGINNPGYN
jgi:hypothetical protein